VSAEFRVTIRNVLVRLAVLAVVGAAVGAAVAPLVGAAAATVAPPRRPPTVYYLAFGASESLGVQPVGAGGSEIPTAQGYADALVAIERARWPGLQLVHVGCPGITAEAALEGGGPCRFAAGSQLAAAVDFLRHHQDQTVLTTVDLGFNDLWPCLVAETVNEACVRGALERVAHALPLILERLRAAGGSSMEIVGLLHNDPYLAAWRQGPEGEEFSAGALSAIDRLNATLSAIYAEADVHVADVAAAFALGTAAPVRVAGDAMLPRDVAKDCALSWMCDRHNIHLNADGYMAVAETIAAALRRTSDTEVGGPGGTAPFGGG
jgi:lysophospholipase L1-like esterase